VYIDDIIIFSKSFKEHLNDLEVLPDRLIAHNLQLKASKCHLFQNALTYLGYVVTPTNVTELKSFLKEWSRDPSFQ
jgi:hypothetical protein